MNWLGCGCGCGCCCVCLAFWLSSFAEGGGPAFASAFAVVVAFAVACRSRVIPQRSRESNVVLAFALVRSSSAQPKNRVILSEAVRALCEPRSRRTCGCSCICRCSRLCRCLLVVILRRRRRTCFSLYTAIFFKMRYLVWFVDILTKAMKGKRYPNSSLCLALLPTEENGSLSRRRGVGDSTKKTVN